ncbi:MAG TPA: hypothetical protein VFI25_10680, partial [Planctomycetota bacterium]|nr:hypothetical protein [Planctomycetota bacterium]
NAEGQAVGLVDFDACEADGLPLTAVWTVPSAVGSGTWPEWLGAAAHDFTVELAPSGVRPKITALIYKDSGHRRERAAVEQAIAAAVVTAREQAVAVAEDPERAVADLRAILGGPGRPLALDAAGRTARRPELPQRPQLPLVGRQRSHESGG